MHLSENKRGENKSQALSVKHQKMLQNNPKEMRRQEMRVTEFNYKEQYKNTKEDFKEVVL